MVALVPVAIGSAGLGGFLVALFRQRHERDQALRDRMLTAADNLTTRLQHALSFVDAVDPDSDPSLRTSVQEARNRLAEFERRIDEVAAHSARIALLFHPNSPAAEKAISAWGWLHLRHKYARKMIDEGEHPAVHTQEMFAAARENAIGAHVNFNTEVWEALSRPRRRRPKLALRDNYIPGMDETQFLPLHSPSE